MGLYKGCKGNLKEGLSTGEARGKEHERRDKKCLREE
jgi:hypothetical protein